MVETQFHTLRQSNSANESLKMLAKEANLERAAIGYPAQIGTIRYSNTVRALVAESFSYGVSASVIASAASVTTKTIQNWLKSEKQSSFRELRIVSTDDQNSEHIIQVKQEHLNDNCGRCVEFIFLSGVRAQVDRRDLNENLLNLLVHVKEI